MTAVDIARHSQRGASGWALLGAAAAGGMVVLAHDVSAKIDWRLVLVARSVVTLVVALVVLRRTRPPLPARIPRALWVRSFVGAGAIVCNFYAYAALPAGDASILVNASPLWVAIASWLWLGQRQRPATWVAVLAAWSGMAIVQRPNFAHAGPAVAVGIVSGILVAIVLMSLARLRTLPSSYVVAHFSLTASLLALALSVVPLRAVSAWSGLDSSMTPRVAIELAGVCVCGLVNQLASTRAYQTGRSARVAIVGLSQVAIAFALEFLFVGRVVELPTLVGLALVLAPVGWLLVHGKETKHVFEVPLRAAPDIDEAAERARATAVLERAIAEAERVTACEVRVHVEHRGIVGEADAIQRFEELGVAKTIRRNGLLLVVALGDQRAFVVADEGIGDVVPRRVLERALASTQGATSWIDDLADRIRAMAIVLASPFPWHEGDTNELPDEITYGSEV